MVFQMVFALNLVPKGRPKYFIGKIDILHPKIVAKFLQNFHITNY